MTKSKVNRGEGGKFAPSGGKVSWRLEEASRNAHLIRVSGISVERPFVALLTSDWHWDNPLCRRELLKSHLDSAVKQNAPIFCFGDLFCGMQGRFDKRSSKDDIRPEHQSGDYLDALVNTATNWLAPYKSHLAILGDGNHESSIKLRHETDLLERLSERLRALGGITRRGGYGGFVKFVCHRGHAAPQNSNGSIRLYYHHGFGGGGPITKGTIDWSRYWMAAEADIYVAGHIHYRNRDEGVRIRMTDQHKLVKSSVHFIRCGTYKDDFDDGYGGWHVEKGRGPRPLGGWWLKVSLEREGAFRVTLEEA